MIPVIPTLHVGAHLMMIVEEQEDFQTLPASVGPDGLVMSEWQPTPEELSHLIMGGRVRLWQQTCGEPMQPINLEVTEPVPGTKES